MNVTQILFAILVPLLTVALGCAINIKIKYAETREEAVVATASLFAIVLSIVGNLACVGGLIWLFLSAPLSKSFVAAAMIYSFSLAHSYLLWFVPLVSHRNKLWQAIERQSNTMNKHADVTGLLVNVLRPSGERPQTPPGGESK